MIAHWKKRTVDFYRRIARKTRESIHAFLLGAPPPDPGTADFFKIIRSQRLTDPGAFDFKILPESSCRDFEILCHDLAAAKSKASETFDPLENEYLQAALNFIEFQGDIATDYFFRANESECAHRMARACGMLRSILGRAPSPRTLGLALSSASDSDSAPELGALGWASELAADFKKRPWRLDTRLGAACEYWVFLCERVALLGARTALARLDPENTLPLESHPQSREASWLCATSLSWPAQSIDPHQRAAILDLICTTADELTWGQALPETAFSSWPEFMAARLAFFMRKIDAGDVIGAITSEAISPACRSALEFETPDPSTPKTRRPTRL